MKRPHVRFMNKAIAKAKEGIRKGQTPFGACIVKNGRVISVAYNTVWKTSDATAHAEINAIRQACRRLRTIDLSDCTIYSTCEPCPMCFSASHWARISRIIYGARICDAKSYGFNELRVSNKLMKREGKSPIRVAGSFMRKECQELFKIWRKNQASKAY